MQLGNWVPIDKRLVKFLPKSRKYTEMEAAFSLSIDYDNQNNVTVSGYSKLWGWSRTKVNNFLNELGVVIFYPDNTKSVQKQKGQIKKQKEDRKETEKRQIRFIDSKGLGETKNSKKTEKEQKKNRLKDTTIDPSLKPNPKPIFPENSIEFRLALFLLRNIRKNKQDYKEPNLQKWSKDADLLLRQDKRNLEEVKKLIQWVQNDSFEKTNVLSISKLRARYDQLLMKMCKPSKKETKNPKVF